MRERRAARVIPSDRVSRIRFEAGASRTLAGCFKYRNKIAKDTVLEALTLYRDRFKPKPQKLIDYAKVCRVEQAMHPCLKALSPLGS